MNKIPRVLKIKAKGILQKLRDCEIASVQNAECDIIFTTCKGEKFTLDLDYINAYLDLYNTEEVKE